MYLADTVNVELEALPAAVVAPWLCSENGAGRLSPCSAALLFVQDGVKRRLSIDIEFGWESNSVIIATSMDSSRQAYQCSWRLMKRCLVRVSIRHAIKRAVQESPLRSRGVSALRAAKAWRLLSSLLPSLFQPNVSLRVLDRHPWSWWDCAELP